MLVSLSNVSTRPGRIDSLDGLRGLAALIIVGNHWELTPGILQAAHPGFMLFFAISAFLQTRALLRRRAEGSTRGRLAALRAFHLRRAIRVVPVVWFVLIATALIGVSDIREALGWHLAFLSNVQLSITQEWPETATVFWSTAALEQFYLVWPALILLLPSRLLPYLMIGTIAAAFAFRVGVIDLTGNYFVAKTMAIGVADAFAVGALTAWAVDRSPSLRRTLTLAAPVAAPALLALWLAIYNELVPGLGPGLSSSSRMLLMTLACGLLVAMLAFGRWGAAQRLLNARPLRELGAISLGIFLWHQFAWALVDLAGAPFLVTAAVAFTLTLITAWLTYRLLEQPLDAVKRRVSRPRSREAALGGLSA